MYKHQVCDMALTPICLALNLTMDGKALSNHVTVTQAVVSDELKVEELQHLDDDVFDVCAQKVTE